MSGTEPQGAPRGHEPRDVNARGILGVAAGLLITAAVVHAALWLQVRLMAGPPLPAPAAEPELPPEPRLETGRGEDLAALRAEEDRLLGGYAWVDRANGVVRIPIERAKEALLERAR